MKCFLLMLSINFWQLNLQLDRGGSEVDEERVAVTQQLGRFRGSRQRTRPHRPEAASPSEAGEDDVPASSDDAEEGRATGRGGSESGLRRWPGLVPVPVPPARRRARLSPQAASESGERSGRTCPAPSP